MNYPLKGLRSLIAAAGLAMTASAIGGATDLMSTARAAPTRSPQLDQAVAALRAITTMRADFVQTDRAGKRTSGVMTLKRPGRIRFQYGGGVPLLIVSDGRALTLIDYGVRQVQRWPIKNSPLGALLDPSRDLASYGKLQPTGDPNAISVEVRDSAHPEYGVITLVFVRQPSAPGGLELTGWAALDSQNMRTIVRLSDHRYGMPIADSAFRWTDPRIAVRR